MRAVLADYPAEKVISLLATLVAPRAAHGPAARTPAWVVDEGAVPAPKEESPVLGPIVRRQDPRTVRWRRLRSVHWDYPVLCLTRFANSRKDRNHWQEAKMQIGPRLTRSRRGRYGSSAGWEV